MKKAMRVQKPPTSKRRKNRQREKRFATAAANAQIGAARKRLRADAPCTVINRPTEQDMMIFISKGLFGRVDNVSLRVDYASLAGACEDRQELAKLVNNVGILVTASLFKHNLSEGIDKLGESIAKWAGIDLEALRAAAAIDTEADDDAPPAAEPTPESISDFSPGADSEIAPTTSEIPTP